MKFVVFLILTCVYLTSGADAKTLTLRVDHDVLDTCHFGGTSRCILVTDKPALLLFQVGDELSIQPTSPDSEVPGVMVFVSGHRFNLKRQLDPMPIEWQPNDFSCSSKMTSEAVCFNSRGAKDALIILPPGTDFDTLTLLFNDRVPGVLVSPMNPVGGVLDE